MKTKVNLIIILALTLAMAVAACGSAEKKTTTNEQVAAKKTYQCPMKCEGDKTYDKAGKCPQCKMDLEEQKVVN